MSTPSFTEGFGGKDSRWTQTKKSQDFDLNLAPIIDCFTVLIAFVMISTAFASIGVLDGGIVAGGDQAVNASQSSDVRLRINLHRTGAAEMQLTGKEAREIPVPAGEQGLRDDAALTRNLDALKIKWPGLKQATLAADNNVPYQEVVAALETIRKSLPGVSLGGF